MKEYNVSHHNNIVNTKALNDRCGVSNEMPSACFLFLQT